MCSTQALRPKRKSAIPIGARAHQVLQELANNLNGLPPGLTGARGWGQTRLAGHARIAAMQRIAGMWWLPESPSETVPGHLQQEGDQFVLHLVGSLVGPEGRAGVLPVILGRNGDERVSLLDSVWRGSGGSSSGTLTHESWRVFTVLRGAGVDGRETPAFDVASVELDGLAHFMNLRLIEFDRQVPDDDVREVAVVRRPPRIAAITADSEYELFSGWSTHYGMRDLNYQYHASLILRLSALVSLSDVDYRYVRPMRHLLAFASAGDMRNQSDAPWPDRSRRSSLTVSTMGAARRRLRPSRRPPRSHPAPHAVHLRGLGFCVRLPPLEWSWLTRTVRLATCSFRAQLETVGTCRLAF